MLRYAVSCGVSDGGPVHSSLALRVCRVNLTRALIFTTGYSERHSEPPRTEDAGVAHNLVQRT